MSLIRLIEGKGEAKALCTATQAYTYQDLYEHSIQRANTWRPLIKELHSRIAILDTDPFEIILSIFACSHLGLVFSVLPSYQGFPLWREEILEDLKPHFIAQKDLLSPSFPTASLCASDVSAIFYTSGSTAKAKGVQHSAQSLMLCAQEMVDALTLSSSDRALLILPISFHYGFSILSSTFTSGGCLFLSEACFPTQIWEECDLFQCSTLASTPHFWQLLRKVHPPESSSSLRKIILAGDSPPKGLLPTLQVQFPKSHLHLFYGCTETLRASHHIWTQKDPENILGKSLPSAILAQNEDGELTQQGATLMLGYWDESTQNPSYPKSHSLGDIVEQREQSIWLFLSRSSDIIKARGLRVSPAKIETILVQNQNILESIVFQKNGIIEVALVLKTMQDMSEYLLVIPHWIRPKKLHYFHKMLPRSPRGKKSRQWIVNNVLYPKPVVGNHKTPPTSKSPH